MEKKRSLKQQDRLRLTYKFALSDQQYEVELPLTLLVMGDYAIKEDERLVEDCELISIDKDNFNKSMKDLNLELDLIVTNKLSDDPDEKLSVSLKFESLKDFEPDSIVMQVPELIDFIKNFDGRKPTVKELNVLCKQLDAILHHPDFQQLEAAWRGLKFLVDRTDFRENIKIELLNISKEELLEDFECDLKVTQYGLYRMVYSRFYEFGGEPYGAIIANYEFAGFSKQDIRLLQYISCVAAMSHCPFIASAGPKFFGIDDFNELPRIKDLQRHFEGLQYIKWQSFRESDDARNVALAMPRFLLRLPYDSESNEVKAFNYNENVSESHKHYLWGNAVFALASRITDSFAKYRWCSNITGGMVEDLPIYMFENKGAVKVVEAVEVLIDDRLEIQLAEQGFIPLIMRKGSDSACFFSANSVQKPKSFPDTPEGRKASLDYKLNAQFPYLFFITRFAHHIMALYKVNLGRWRSKKDLLQDKIRNWIEQYVTQQEVLSSEVYNCKSLRKAQIVLEDWDNEGYVREFKFLLKVSPHVKYMGEYFNLSLFGLFW